LARDYGTGTVDGTEEAGRTFPSNAGEIPTGPHLHGICQAKALMVNRTLAGLMYT